MERVEIGQCCIVSYLPEVATIQVEWCNMPSTDVFQKGCNAVLDMLIEKKVSKVLVDNTKAKIFAMKDQQWLNNNWLPRAEKAGYRYSATVLGDSDAFVKFATQSIANKRDKTKFINRSFKSKSEALVWLKSL
ncbi:MAG: hypothetical protein RBR35_09565 [Salinivirgaceae bacterium]|nr:hypothetical protein [Salinivirgaceae bacterium]